MRLGMVRTILAGVAMAVAASPARADLAEIRQRGTLRLLVILDDDEPEFVSGADAAQPGFDRECSTASPGCRS